MATKLKDKILSFAHNPYGFVLFAFPWGQGPLHDSDGPDKWQTKVLKTIGEKGLSLAEALRLAVASGHGVGKTALIAWIIIWFMSTRFQPQIVVTANTKPQLDTKTWRELSKWHQFAINKVWFKWTATKFYHVQFPGTWFAAAIPWSKENSESFAGTHERHVLIIYDEASMIDSKIWEVTEGAMTTKGAIWIAFGNPTRNTGRFKECFPGGEHAHRWISMQVDSRDAKAANQEQIQQWIEDYGEDSDFVRIRVKGEFPRAGSTQYIPEDIVIAAYGKSVHPDTYCRLPKVLGVDVARYGDDESSICRRHGTVVPLIETFRELDNMTLAQIVQRHIDEWKPDAVFIDEGGGQGVVDRLRQLGYDVLGVQFGGKPLDTQQYANKRAEMWGRTKEWLAAGGAIPKDPDLKAQLIGPEYGYNARDQIQLERKEDMKKRGLASPDRADALCLTFAMNVPNKTREEEIRDELNLPRKEYDPLRWGLDDPNDYDPFRF